MKTLKIFLFTVFAFIFLPAFSQNSLKGKITDTLNGNTLPGAIVYISDLKIAAQSNADGAYTFNNLPKGTYIVEVDLLGYSGKAQTVKIDGDVIQNFVLSESEYEEDEVVITGSSTASDRRNTPYSVTDVSNSYLKENSATNMVDMVSKIPGVSGITDGQSISKPVIRGLGYNRVLTINDGVEQVDQPWFDEFGIEADPDAVNRVEILKGPASLAYGSDAISGVLNFIPEPTMPEEQTKGDILFNYQTNNGLFNNMAHIAGNCSGLAWSARIDNVMAHAYQNQFDGYVLNSQFSNFNTDGTIGLHRKWGYSQLHASYFDMATGIIDGTRDSVTGTQLQAVSYPNLNGGAPTHVFPTNQQFQSYTPLVINQRIRHTKIVWDNSFAIGNGRISAIFSWQKNQHQETNNPSMPNNPDIYYYSNGYTYDVRYISPQMGGFNVSAGANGAAQSSQSLGTLLLIPNYNLFQLGGFAIVSKKLGSLNLSGGVRYDIRTFNGMDQWVDSTNQAPVPPTAPNAIHEFHGFTSNFNGVSGSLGATYNFSKAVFAKANIAKGFRAPNVAECAANGVHDGTVVYEIGDHALIPEISTEEDVALGINSENFNFEADWFMNTISNFIYAKGLKSVLGGDSINNSLNAAGLGAAPVYRYSQTQAALTGAEIALDLHPQALSWLDLNITYCMVNAQLSNVPDSIKYLPFVPPARFTADLKFHIKKIGKGIADAYIKFGILNCSQQNKVYQQFAVYNGLSTATTPFEYKTAKAAMPGYTLFTMGVGGKIMTNGHEFCEVYITCNNVFNTPYMDYMSRFKYLPVNYATHRVGVFNMGRNVSFKIIIPFNFKKKL